MVVTAFAVAAVSKKQHLGPENERPIESRAQKKILLNLRRDRELLNVPCLMQSSVHTLVDTTYGRGQTANVFFLLSRSRAGDRDVQTALC